MFSYNLKKLKTLETSLPELSSKLSGKDILALCERVSSITLDVQNRVPADQVNKKIDKVFSRLQDKFPCLITITRGAAESNDDAHISVVNANEYAESIRGVFNIQIVNQKLAEDEKEKMWRGMPELMVFDRLTPALRERAFRIRDWCEEQLEFMHSRGMLVYFTAHGIGHSKRVLHHGTDILRAYNNYFAEPFAYYAMYVAAYCHDIGMMFREGEDPDDIDTFTMIRKTHGRRTWEMILGNKKAGIQPMWKTMGFGSEREAMLIANMCAVHQKRAHEDLLKIPIQENLFFDSSTRGIPVFALAGVLRLADALDCHEKRLPPPSYLLHKGIPPESLHEYLKQEIVEAVEVDMNGTINIGMRVKYHYPLEPPLVLNIRKEFEEEISAIAAILRSCGIKLPQACFNTVEALFLDEHPYIK